MSLHDKMLVADGLKLVSKDGRPWHVSQNGLVAMCGQPYDDRWQWKFGPIARHMLCHRCEQDPRVKEA